MATNADKPTIPIIIIITIQWRTYISCINSATTGDADGAARPSDDWFMVGFTFPLDNHGILVIVFANFLILHDFYLVSAGVPFASIRHEILFI